MNVDTNTNRSTSHVIGRLPASEGTGNAGCGGCTGAGPKVGTSVGGGGRGRVSEDTAGGDVGRSPKFTERERPVALPARFRAEPARRAAPNGAGFGRGVGFAGCDDDNLRERNMSLYAGGSGASKPDKCGNPPSTEVKAVFAHRLNGSSRCV